MQSLFEILMLLTNVVWTIMIAHIIMSWLIAFNILSPYQPVVGAIWGGLNQLLEPIYRPIRNILPQTGGLDLAPLVAFIGLIAIQTVLRNNAAAFF